jgi:hypothetical protein
LLGVKAASKKFLKASQGIYRKNGNSNIGGLDVIVTFDTHLPLNERLLRIDHIQARRYSKLAGISLEIATEGIIRHLKACDRMDVNPETSAVREIIDDALNGRRVFAETAEQTRAA